MSRPRPRVQHPSVFISFIQCILSTDLISHNCDSPFPEHTRKKGRSRSAGLLCHAVPVSRCAGRPAFILREKGAAGGSHCRGLGIGIFTTSISIIDIVIANVYASITIVIISCVLVAISDMSSIIMTVGIAVLIERFHLHGSHSFTH